MNKWNYTSRTQDHKDDHHHDVADMKFSYGSATIGNNVIFFLSGGNVDLSLIEKICAEK